LCALFECVLLSLENCNRLRLRNNALSDDSDAKRVVYLLDNFDRTRSAVFMVNLIASIAAAVMSTALSLNWDRVYGPVLAAAVLPLVVFLLGKILPAAIARENADEIALKTAPYIRLIMWLLAPLTALYELLGRALRKMRGRRESLPSMTEDDFQTMIETGEEEGVLNEQESELIQSALEFSDTLVQDVITPRVDIVGIDVNATPAEVIERVLSEKYSRLPVYDGTMDKIVGIISAKACLRKVIEGELIDVRELMTPPLFVTRYMTAEALLEGFRRHRGHIAIVADDYGGTIGMVTLEDVLEELVGDIWDEKDEVVEEYLPVEEGIYEVSGDMNIYDLFEELEYDDRDFQSEYTTVGGWATDVLERFPEPNDSFVFEDYVFTIIEVDNMVVEKLRIEKLQKAE
jgi:CBS domain containing-hemolysin-like protein